MPNSTGSATPVGSGSTINSSDEEQSQDDSLDICQPVRAGPVGSEVWTFLIILGLLAYGLRVWRRDRSKLKSLLKLLMICFVLVVGAVRLGLGYGCLDATTVYAAMYLYMNNVVRPKALWRMKIVTLFVYVLAVVLELWLPRQLAGIDHCWIKTIMLTVQSMLWIVYVLTIVLSVKAAVQNNRVVQRKLILLAAEFLVLIFLLLITVLIRWRTIYVILMYICYILGKKDHRERTSPGTPIPSAV